MDTRKEFTISLLNKNNVSVQTKQFITINGVEQQLGETTSVCYNNCPYDRQRLKDALPEEHKNAIFAIWGDTPLLPDPEQPEQ